jgi:hypothetical protein
MKRVLDEGYPRFSLYESVVADASRPGHFTRSFTAHTLGDFPEGQEFAMATYGESVIRVKKNWTEVWNLADVAHCGSVNIQCVTRCSDRRITAICERGGKLYMAGPQNLNVYDCKTLEKDDERKFTSSLSAQATPFSMRASDTHLCLHEEEGDNKALTILDRACPYGLSNLSALVNAQAKTKIEAFAISADQLAVADGDRSLGLWSVREEKPISVINDAHQETVTKVQILSGQLVSAAKDGTVKFWDLKNLKEPVKTVNFKDPVLDCEVVEGGLFAKTGCSAKKEHIKVRDLQTGLEIVNLTLDTVRKMAIMRDKLILQTEETLFCFPFHI